MKAIGYVRVSEVEQGSSDKLKSLRNQETIIRDHAKAKGYELVKIYNEGFKSGAGSLKLKSLEVFDAMLNDGKTIYGYQLKGEWLECGDKLKWLKSFFYMSLRDERFGKELKEYIKNLK